MTDQALISEPESPLNGVQSPQPSVLSLNKAAAGGPVSPKRPKNSVWIVAGIALIVAAGIGAAVIASSFNQSIGVLVAAREIPEGSVITAEDLTVADIAATGEVRAIGSADMAEVVGQVASGPIGQGQILHRAQFVDSTASEAFTAIVGAVLTQNQFPAVTLGPGDTVRLIEVSARTGPQGELPGREIGVAEIVQVGPVDSGQGQHFAFRLGESSVDLVTDRIAQGRLHIAVISQAPTASTVDPLNPADPLTPAAPGEGS